MVLFLESPLPKTQKIKYGQICAERHVTFRLFPNSVLTATYPRKLTDAGPHYMMVSNLGNW